MPITIEELQKGLDDLDGGVLKGGKHEPDSRQFCVLEFDSIMRHRPLSDNAITLPDLRPLNDAFLSDDAARTDALLPVMAALWDWTAWSPERRQSWTRRIVIETVRRLIAELPGLSSVVTQQCRTVSSLDEAVKAAEAARTEAAKAAKAAEAVAARAAEAARVRVTVLRRACEIWVQAAKQLE